MLDGHALAVLNGEGLGGVGFCHLRTGRGAGTAAAFGIKPLTGQEVRVCNLRDACT